MFWTLGPHVARRILPVVAVPPTRGVLAAMQRMVGGSLRRFVIRQELRVESSAQVSEKSCKQMGFVEVQRG